MKKRAIATTKSIYRPHGEHLFSTLATQDLPDFLAALSAYYEQHQALRLIIDCAELVNNPALARALDFALRHAGWTRQADTVFRAHVGVFPGSRPMQGLTISSVTEANLVAFVRTILIAYSDTDTEPSPPHLESEITRYRAEMANGGCGLLATINDVPVGSLWGFEDAQDVWVSSLGVCQQYRRSGIAHALLKTRVSTAYSMGYRSVVVRVQFDNAEAQYFCDQLGFSDEIYRQWCYTKGQSQKVAQRTTNGPFPYNLTWTCLSNGCI